MSLQALTIRESLRKLEIVTQVELFNLLDQIYLEDDIEKVGLNVDNHIR